MIRHLRLAVAAVLVASLASLAGIATGLGGGRSAAAGRPLVIQPAPVGAAAERPTIPTTTTTVPAITTTTSKTAPPKTVPATTAARATTTAPRVVRTTAPTVARPAVVTPVTSAALRPTPTLGGGRASDFTVVGYKWSSCQVITVNSSGPDIGAIVSELASITGLHLQLISGPAEINVSWGSVPAGGEIGVTLWRAVGGVLTSAGITLSQQAQPWLQTVLRHELGHALGLGHAAQPDEVMYPSVGDSSPKDYQAGDISGLKAVGAAAGC